MRNESDTPLLLRDRLGFLDLRCAARRSFFLFNLAQPEALLSRDREGAVTAGARSGHCGPTFDGAVTQRAAFDGADFATSLRC
jgi:hypothetical protein